MSDSEIFGAFASVCIRFDGDLRSLADRLSTALNIGNFNVEPSEYPPHNESDSAEALGCELCLEVATATVGEFNLRLETEHAVEEIFHGRMHDISPWLARFLAMTCDLDVAPVT